MLKEKGEILTALRGGFPCPSFSPSSDDSSSFTGSMQNVLLSRYKARLVVEMNIILLIEFLRAAARRTVTPFIDTVGSQRVSKADETKECTTLYRKAFAPSLAWLKC